jgi:hypothetical protein
METTTKGEGWNFSNIKKLSKTNYSTLVNNFESNFENLMVPPELWDPFQKIRIPNISPLRCGPHISLAYPFIEKDYFPIAAEALTEELKRFKPFTIKFSTFG